MRSFALAAVTVAALVASCRDPEGKRPPAELVTSTLQEPGFVALRTEETLRRQATDYRSAPDARGVLGPDPVAMISLVDGTFLVLLARVDAKASSAIVHLSAKLEELRRTTIDTGASTIVRTHDGTILVGFAQADTLQAFLLKDGEIVRASDKDRRGFARVGVRALATRGPCLYGVDEDASELRWACDEARGVASVPRGPVTVSATAHFVTVASPVGHTVSVFPLAKDGVPIPDDVRAIGNDGPLFAAAAVEDSSSALYVVSGGVEDHPLDRRGGSFGFVDSFVYVDRVDDGKVTRIASVNVGELGVVTPKALLADVTFRSVRVRVAGYASEVGADIYVPLDGTGLGQPAPVPVPEGVSIPGGSPTATDRGECRPPSSTTFATLPGLVSLVRGPDNKLLGPSPLLDGVVVIGAAASLVPLARASVEAHPLAQQEATLRLGEALFYTTAMAPWQITEGPLSRFTCETCHFEGGIDGRIHATGRGDIVATTKPLFGLANNGPHFTRALDDDLTEMVYAEFRVTAANTGHGEWFDLYDTELSWPKTMPWLEKAQHHAVALRRALAFYLQSLPHPPKRAAREHWDEAERRGAQLFASHCATCHAARLVANDASTEVPFAKWEPLVLAKETSIVWGRDGYENTGIVPMVHPRGARPSSLRRIRRKTPYFTNGSAKTLEDVLGAARFDAHAFFHAGGPATARAFSPSEVTDLKAFLELL